MGVGPGTLLTAVIKRDFFFLQSWEIGIFEHLLQVSLGKVLGANPYNSRAHSIRDTAQLTTEFFSHQLVVQIDLSGGNRAAVEI